MMICWKAQLRDGKLLGVKAEWSDVTDVRTWLYRVTNGPQQHLGCWEASERHLGPFAKEHYAFSEAPAPPSLTVPRTDE